MRADDFPISVVELIQQAAWRFPERTALVLPDERLSYADLFEWLAPRQLLDEPPETWAADWARADPGSFRPRAL